MNELCGCCEGIERLTPITIGNRPGLNALVYRVGTHASFLETMLARLSASDFPELRGLTIRTADDPAIALLDAWATVADVLTFYQERVANEGYLRTATERRSILELAHLVGYRLRPGVAASVYLAYALEKNHDVTILPGNRAQSVPDPGQLPQSFETAETLEARFLWNILKPRLTRPQHITQDQTDSTKIHGSIRDGAIYLQGTSTGLKPGDALLLIFGADDGQQVFTRVLTVEAQAADNRTKVTVDPAPLPQSLQSNALLARSLAVSSRQGPGVFGSLVKQLSVIPSVPPRNSQRLERSVEAIFGRQSDIQQQLLLNFSPILQGTLYNALADSLLTGPLELKQIQALHVKAAPFGHNAPLRQRFSRDGRFTGEFDEWPLANAVNITIELTLSPPVPGPAIVAAAPGGNTGPTFGGNTPTSASVTITWNGITWANTNIQNLTPGSQDVSLDQTAPPASQTNPFTINIDISAREMTFTFPLGNFNHTIRFISEGANLGVQIDSGDEDVVSKSPNEQRKDTEQHKIGITYQDTSISVVEQGVVDSKRVVLDAQYDKITPESWVVVERPDRNIFSRVKRVQTVSIAAYGITGRVTQLTLDKDWLETTDRLLLDIRGITVYAQSEQLSQAEEPIEEDIEDVEAETGQTPKVGTDKIELDRLYDGLKSGRWAIVSGERTDVLQSDGTPIRGIRVTELVMLASVTQDVQKLPGSNKLLPGDKTHTFLHLAKPLKYTYKRDTVTIYGNVVPATHGETRTETLGSGDGSKALQRFTLHQSPLTYLSALTAAGAVSTLQVRVNDILWHEAESLAGLKPTDRSFITETDDASQTTVIFGNGQYGARLPTGVENVKAVYRSGIGKPGNVRAEQITLLATKPLGVKSVVNPLRASGGADRESRDQARRNIPVALLALDRLVSVQDYADFARTYAGISKASAVRISDGRRQLVHLTIVGADNIPIDDSSDLFQNLFQSLRQFGDLNEPLTMVPATVKFIVISAAVRLLPDYALEFVEPKIRAALLDFFSFERRELGQPVFQSEVFSVIQSIPGVDYVDLLLLGAVDQDTVVTALDKASQTPPDPSDPKETETEEFLELLGLAGHNDVPVSLAKIDPKATNPAKRIAPAQLAFLTPDLPDTLILTELPK